MKDNIHLHEDVYKRQPKYGFPPNFLVALNPINTGKKVNAAFENKLIIDAKSAHCGYASVSYTHLNFVDHRKFF